MSSLQDMPEILLLCMEEKFIKAFDEALPAFWPSFAGTNPPKLSVTTLHESLAGVPPTTSFQLVVSPANSYARLDGAFDDAISRQFCLPNHDYDTLTYAAQEVLYERWKGFAPPGTCTLVPFPAELEGGNPWGCKWVAICPTMRSPDDVTWDREVVYECVWSLFCELERWNRQVRENKTGERIDRILMTPMATGTGNVSKERWASQLVLAMKHFVGALENPERWSNLGWRDVDDELLDVEKTWKPRRKPHFDQD
ncbi:hypothetical protein AJ80_00260 [Polytolypa hystricis UAMH7299]|uniref:Macro-like domain-containing protein n=1 Tax=Polytolypa hystricis (strain UAMH7299) TaxID=1447883 RepID=A0A2B7Z323_POLH7|nr:hypothetical protein AJ80_00260 [Polytolypa hystricis UAMH7299]